MMFINLFSYRSPRVLFIVFKCCLWKVFAIELFSDFHFFASADCPEHPGSKENCVKLEMSSSIVYIEVFVEKTKAELQALRSE